MWVWSLGWEDPLEKDMAIHSGILDWRIQWTEEPGGLQSVGSQRVRHDWRDLACMHQFSSVTQSCSTLCDPMDCSKPGFPASPTPRACSNSCPLSQWCYPTISSSECISSVQFSSVAQSCPTPWDPMNCSTPGLPVHQHARPLCPSPTPRVHPNPCPSSQWCHPTISSSVVPFSCPQSLPASGSFPMSQLFTWGGQSIGVSASASILPMNTQDWSPLGWTGCISLQSKGLSRVFSNTTVLNV